MRLFNPNFNSHVFVSKTIVCGQCMLACSLPAKEVLHSTEGFPLKTLLRMVPPGTMAGLVLLLFSLAAQAHNLDGNVPVIEETTMDLIRKEGFTAEEHAVYTSEGYVLQLHRIPGKGPPVLFYHGLFGTSADWVLLSGDKSLGFITAAAGYDVWLANARGTSYSRNNTAHSVYSRMFWKFSFTESGTQDIPQLAAYIQRLTGRRQLAFVGHSYGTSAFFAGASVRQDYAPTFSVMVALSPLAFCQHMRSPLRHFASFIRGVEDTLEQDLEIMGGNEFHPRQLVMAAWTVLGCQGNVLNFNLCNNLRYFVGGLNPYITNMSQLPHFERHASTASSQTILHYIQLMKSGTFSPYNQGVRMNIANYMREVPPEFPLQKVLTPVALVWSDYDILADPLNVVQLKSILPNVINDFRVPHSAFGSNDFLMSNEAHKLVYPHVIDILNQHT